MALGDAKPTLISIALYVVLIVVGAVILMFTERHGLKTTSKSNGQRPGNISSVEPNPKNLTQHTQEYLESHGSANWTAKDVEKLLNEIKTFEGTKKGATSDVDDDDDDGKAWRRKIGFETFAKWEYFVVCTVSTIGYGDITPLTSGAKILTVLVQVVGIPINLYMFISIAAFFTNCISCLKNCIASKCQRRNASRPNIVCFFLCIFVVLLYVGAGGIAIGLSQGWKWYDGMYWSFSAATTVGYGDIIPKHHAFFAFVFFGTIVMLMPVYALCQTLKKSEEESKEDRLMAKTEEI